MATSERRRKTDGRKGPGGGPAEAAHCPCCPEVKEDDMHMLTGCPGTGTDGVVEDFLTFWGETLHEVKVSPKEQFSPTRCWGESWKLQLAVGLIPMQLRELCLMVFSRESTLIHVLQKVSVKMGSWLADRMRDREARRAVNGVPQRARGEQPLPGLSAREVRETLRVTMDDAAPSAVPAHGDARMRWASNSAKEWILSLARGVLEDGPTGVQLLATWENQTGEEFTKDPPAPVVARINSWGVFLARTMSTLIPHTKSVQGRVSRWGVVLRDAVDANVWRTEKEEAERGRVVRPRAQLRAAVDLVGWINQFEAADCVDAAESDEAASGLALLTLWELEHGMKFPAQGSGIYFVKAFARALGIALKSAKEPFRLCATAYVKRPLAQNMTPVRHVRFPIAIRRPLGHAFWPAWKETLVSLLRSRRDRGIRVARRGRCERRGRGRGGAGRTEPSRDEDEEVREEATEDSSSVPANNDSKVGDDDDTDGDDDDDDDDADDGEDDNDDEEESSSAGESDEEGFKCPHCPRVFQAKQNATRHARECVRNPRNAAKLAAMPTDFVCPQCGMGFRARARLATHLGVNKCRVAGQKRRRSRNGTRERERRVRQRRSAEAARGRKRRREEAEDEVAARKRGVSSRPALVPGTAGRSERRRGGRGGRASVAGHGRATEGGGVPHRAGRGP